MKQGKVIGFNAAKMAEQMMANAVAEQNRRLIAYAKEEIKKLDLSNFVDEFINEGFDKNYISLPWF